MNKKKPVVLLLVCLLALLLFSGTAMAASQIIVSIDGEAVKCDVPPVIENGRILVPLRAIFEGLGMTVSFDSETQTITGYDNDTKIIIQLNNATAFVNQVPVKMDVAAKSINYRTMVPIRFVAESSGAVVSWDSGSKTVLISTVKASSGTSGSSGGTDEGTILSTTEDDDANGYADYILSEYGLFMDNNYAVTFDGVVILENADTIIILMYIAPECLTDFNMIRDLEADALLDEYAVIADEAREEFNKDICLFVIYYDSFFYYPSAYDDNGIIDDTITDMGDGTWLVSYPLLQIDQYLSDYEYYYYTWGY